MLPIFKAHRSRLDRKLCGAPTDVPAALAAIGFASQAPGERPRVLLLTGLPRLLLAEEDDARLVQEFFFFPEASQTRHELTLRDAPMAKRASQKGLPVSSEQLGPPTHQQAPSRSVDNSGCVWL